MMEADPDDAFNNNDFSASSSSSLTTPKTENKKQTCAASGVTKLDGTTPTTTNSSTAAAAPDVSSSLLFDPYHPTTPASKSQNMTSLLDQDDQEEEEEAKASPFEEFLEMEVHDDDNQSTKPTTPEQSNNNIVRESYEEPIQTKSGLLLTHRKTPTEVRYNPQQQQRRRSSSLRYSAKPSSSSAWQSPQAEKRVLETDHYYYNNNHNPKAPQLQRLLSYARLWVVLSAIVLLWGMTLVVHHMRHETSTTSSSTNTAAKQQQEDIATSATDNDFQKNNIRIVSYENQDTTPEQVLLLPLETGGEEMNHHQHHHRRHLLASSEELFADFEAWMVRHNKVYASLEEQEKRFEIWVDNHHRTRQKNQQHGPCRLTKQPVFGSNHLQDLTPQEFQEQYLNAYHAPKKKKQQQRQRRNLKETMNDEPPIMGPHIVTKRHHEDVHRRLVQHYQAQTPQTRTLSETTTVVHSSKRAASSNYCSWYDVSCNLRYIFETYLYGGGIMEPAYDADSYPMAIDWRDMGAVTDVHSQGSCGACWAITAVETIESASFLATGELNDLAEHEVIVCAEECEMCNGGWPQNAFDYVMENNGIPLDSDLTYDGDFLMELTEAMEGTSEEMNENSLKSYQQEICPNGGGNSHSGSNDGGGSYGSSFARYGQIDGYGYATNKCVCYTDGSGCECDSQNEGLAVRNLATYGPAVVCVDASTWQDYDGGIMTAGSGCSSHFMDVNHCVQAVGYAFTSDDDEEEDYEQQGSGSGSGSNSHSGSQDSSSRIGYWIVRNQWSSYWGMNGYAYVAMGDNTCGILNDMLQVYV